MPVQKKAGLQEKWLSYVDRGMQRNLEKDRKADAAARYKKAKHAKDPHDTLLSPHDITVRTKRRLQDKQEMRKRAKIRQGRVRENDPRVKQPDRKALDPTRGTSMNERYLKAKGNQGIMRDIEKDMRYEQAKKRKK